MSALKSSATVSVSGVVWVMVTVQAPPEIGLTVSQYWIFEVAVTSLQASGPPAVHFAGSLCATGSGRSVATIRPALVCVAKSPSSWSSSLTS